MTEPTESNERRHGPYLLSTDPARLDRDAIHAYIGGVSYWAAGRPRDIQDRGIDGSALVVGAYLIDGADEVGAQVGFARMVTDLATFAYLADVYVLDEHQGTGLGTAMVELIITHPAVASCRQLLATHDAHGLYEKFGYATMDDPSRWMLRSRPEY